MHGAPDLWHELMTRLSARVGRYLAAQAEAGAQALQLFDSWVGELSPSDYRRFVLPYTAHALAVAGGQHGPTEPRPDRAGVDPGSVGQTATTGDTPLIHFSTGTAGYLDDIASAGGDVIGVDWRIDLDRAWRLIGADRAIQGNLDPLALAGPWPQLQAAAEAVLRQTGWPDARQPGHIFNLGHGILPQTPPDNVRRLVDWVHEATEQRPERT